MDATADTRERIFTAEESARFIRNRRRRVWAARMLLAALLLVVLVFGPAVFLHLRTVLWLSFLGANVDWSVLDDDWKQGGVTRVDFPISFRSNGRFNNRDVSELRHLHRLESLDLSNAYDISALGLADLKRLPDLKVLDISRLDDRFSVIVAPPPKLADKDLVHLEPLTGLRELYLSGSPITDEGLVHLANLKQLEVLDLEETAVTDAGLVHLRGLTRLKELKLGKAKGARTTVSQKAAMELNQALPDLVIHLKKEYEPE